MKRRKFLQGLLAVTGAAAMPSAALVSEGRAVPPAKAWGSTPPAALARCAFFDYDDNLVTEGMFTPSRQVVIPVRHKVRFSDTHLTPAFDDAVFERSFRLKAQRTVFCYKQVSGPRMPRRGYVI